jgi:hypothetical protein
MRVPAVKMVTRDAKDSIFQGFLCKTLQGFEAFKARLGLVFSGKRIRVSDAIRNLGR